MGEVVKTKCKSCGSNLEYAPNSGNLKCAMCGAFYSFDKSDNYKKRNVELGNLFVVDKKEDFATAIRSCKCCGAKFSGKLMSLTSKCEYCGATMVIDDMGVMPDACVPFAFDKAEALKLFKEEVQKRKFVNKKFKKAPKVDRIESLYIPAYSFSTDVDATYRGQLYTEDKDKDGNTSIHRFNVSGTESASFNDMLVECSEHITQNELKSIEPFVISGARKFVPEFIYGYSVEYYNRTVEESAKIIREIVDSRTKIKILRRYDYDGINSFKVDYTYKNSKYSCMLVPVYKLHFKFKKKKYSPLVNGQNGKVGGKLPTNVGKIIWTAVLLLLGFGLLAGFVYTIATGEVPFLEEILDSFRG